MRCRNDEVSWQWHRGEYGKHKCGGVDESMAAAALASSIVAVSAAQIVQSAAMGESCSHRAPMIEPAKRLTPRQWPSATGGSYE
jgi:hypothetical protein